MNFLCVKRIAFSTFIHYFLRFRTTFHLFYVLLFTISQNFANFNVFRSRVTVQIFFFVISDFLFAFAKRSKIFGDINTLTDTKWLNLFARIKSDLYSNIIIFSVWIYGKSHPLVRTCFRIRTNAWRCWTKWYEQAHYFPFKNAFGCEGGESVYVVLWVKLTS